MEFYHEMENVFKVGFAFAASQCRAIGAVDGDGNER
jgi:hypothetical protein